MDNRLIIDIKRDFEIAKKHGCHVLYEVSHRNGGKTTGVLGLVSELANAEDGKIAVLCRTYKAIADIQSEGTFFDNANKWHDANLSFGTGLDILKDGEKIGTFESIGAARDIKNKGYTGYKYFFIDETQPDDGRYLPNECESLVPSVIESMGRENVLSNDWYLFLSSNNLSNIDRYSDAFGLSPFQKHRYQLRGKALKCFYRASAEALQTVDLYNMFKEYGRRAALAEPSVKANLTVEKRPRHLWQVCTVSFRGQHLYIDRDKNGYFHILTKHAPRNGLLLLGEPEEGKAGKLFYAWSGFLEFSKNYQNGRLKTRDSEQAERCNAMLKGLGIA